MPANMLAPSRLINAAPIHVTPLPCRKPGDDYDRR